MLQHLLVRLYSVAARTQAAAWASTHTQSIVRTSVRTALWCWLVVLGAMITPAFAQVNFNFGIEIAPPPVRVEVVPAPRPGFAWAPGYWAWQDRRHVWVTGHWVKARPGYYWVPERWEHHAGPHGRGWYFVPGRWEHDRRHWERR